MGVTISTQSALAPVSLASTIIGFVSFAFTVGTAIRVFWSNLNTLWSASTELHDYLSNLRQGLYEERSHIRRAKKQFKRRRRSSAARGEKDGHGARYRDGPGEVGPEAALQAMSTAVKHMCEQFRELERPFLKDTAKQSSRRPKDIWAEDALGYSSGGLGEDESTDYLYSMSRYEDCGLKQRLRWLQSKSSMITLLEGLNRLEVRRMGMQMTEFSMWIREHARDMDHINDRLDALDRLEQRMSRVVGIRRVD